MTLVFDPKQLEAIEHGRGPMLVLAGAGTGKTTVLVERVTRLVREGVARPDEILAVTFTIKGAREMRERVQARLGGECAGLRASNFHAYCEGLLRRAGANFGVLTDEDLWVYLRQRIEELPRQRFVRAADPGRFLSDLKEFFSRCQDELVTPVAYGSYLERLRQKELPLPRVSKSKERDALSDQEVLARCQEIGDVFTTVEEMLERDHLGTFGAQIVKAIDLLKKDAALLAEERARSRFVLVDEFQDCNVAQIELAALLAGEEKNLFAVGDPDQAIYHFRGASSAAFDEFLQRFPGSRRVALEKNHRSTVPILACAAGIIAKNPPVVQATSRLGQEFERRPLRSARSEEAAARGEALPSPPVAIVLCDHSLAEAAEVAESVRSLQEKSGCAWSRFAVLYRTHEHRKVAIEEFAARGIPVAVKGVNVLDTAEVRDLMAALRALVNPRDGGSLFRVAALPQFAIRPAGLRDRLKGAEKGADLVSILERVTGGKKVLAALEELRAQAAAARMRVAAVVELAIRRFSLEGRPEPLAAFRRFVADWEKKPIAGDRKLAAFLDYMEHFPQAGGSVQMYDEEAGDEDPREGVRMMTVHAAKGLEFGHVFVLRASSQSFPTGYREPLFEFPAALTRGASAAGSKEIHAQEERRLFYVAMTRARDSLTLCTRPRGKKREVSGYPKEVLAHPALAASRAERPARDYRADIAAAAAPSAVAGVGAWLLLPPQSVASPITLSATTIDKYELCPLKYKISQEWAIPGRAAGAMQFGNVVHTVLKNYYDALLSGRSQSTEALLESFRAALANAGLEDPAQRRLYERQGLEQLREFGELRAAEPPPQVIATEKAFDLTLGGARVVGRVDRLDRIAGARVAIVDYKTGAPKKPEDADDSLQLSLYALAARDTWGLEPERLAFYNLDGNQEVATTRTPEELRAVEERVAEVAARIAAGEFEANPGRHCVWCVYRELCPATEPRLYTIEPSRKPGVS
ncbi:MAG TPA: ATP-dependent DNA helicase [Terriglobales bacterium]|nr:ATP-dependent DNA helicase [Terriglobales bacterium]